MRIITVVLNADQQDTNPYARFTTSALLDYISANFALKLLFRRVKAYNDSKVTVLDGRGDNVTAVLQSDISIVQRIGSVTPTLNSHRNQHQKWLHWKRQGCWYLTYDDQDLVGQGYLTSDKPSFEMVSEKKVEKAFFLKVWWNQFIRFINEKIIKKKSRFFAIFFFIHSLKPFCISVANSTKLDFSDFTLTVNQVFCWNTTNLVGLEGSCLRII